MTDKTVRSAPLCTARFPPMCPHISFTLGQVGERAGNWKRNRIRIQDPTQSDIQSVHSGRSAKNGNGAASQIYSCTYERIYIYICVRMIPQPMPPLLAVVSFGEGPLGGEPAGSNRNYIFKVFSCTLLGALIFSYFYNFN